MVRIAALLILCGLGFSAEAPRILRSLSGPSGRTVDNEFVLDEIRNRFVYPSDNSLVIYFQWEASPGDHVLTGIWKQPDGRVASISPDVKIRTSTTALNCYWIFSLSPGLSNGIWSLEVRVDGTPAGVHSFEIAGMSAEQLSMDQIFKSIGPSVVWVHKLDRTGSKFDRAMGFVIAAGAIATAFQAVDSASSLEVEFLDGRKTPTNQIFALSRNGDWAIVQADTGSLAPIARGDATRLLVGQRLALFTFDSNSRVIGVVDVGGQSMVPGFGGRIHVTPEAAPEAAGSPLLDSAGRAVGIVGGSLKPGARLTRSAAIGNQEVRETLAHGAGGTAINSATPIGEVPSEVPSTTRTLGELAEKGFLTPLLSPMPELVYAGTTNELRKRVPAGLPPEIFEFSQKGPEVGLFTVWQRKGKVSKGVISIRGFDTSNKPRVEGSARKASLSKDAQEVGFTFSPSSLEPGTYRVDLSWDNTPIWRTFVRITD
jgi:hypothetical protein